MSAIDLSEAFANAAHVGRRAFLDTGVLNARLLIYGTTRPATPGDAPGGPALVALVLDKPCASIATGQMTLLSSLLALIANSGSALWARAVNGDDDFAFDCDVTDEAGAGPVKLSATTLFAGGKVALLSAVLA